MKELVKNQNIELMENRVVGVLGVRAIMSNWNADFDKYPKTTAMGDIYGSDKSYKYSMRNYWLGNNENVLCIKTYMDKNGVLSNKSLKERYEELFNNGEVLTETSTSEIAENVFCCIDVKNFGATVAMSTGANKKKAKRKSNKKDSGVEVAKDETQEGDENSDGINISITGAVQIGQGMNKYDGAMPEEVTILSPFSVNGNDNSTLGSVVLVNEAHYVYPFTINPANYKRYIDLGYTKGYTRKDYEKFKAASIVCATALNTCSKEGCENELAIFIEVDSETLLPNLSQYVTFEREDSKYVYNLGFSSLIKELGEKVKSIEIYYNTLDMDITHDLPLDKTQIFDIYTKKKNLPMKNETEVV